jgi:3-hydroxyisobutyrate dehydrogenase-like beta-hydroxyacid dehydrogenase
MKLGLIGLGAMGAPMARNLLEADHELAVWNRSPERVVPLVEAGTRRARGGLPDLQRGGLGSMRKTT